MEKQITKENHQMDIVDSFKNYIIEKQYVLQLLNHNLALKETLKKDEKLASYNTQQDKQLIDRFQVYKETENKIMEFLEKIEQPYRSILYYRYIKVFVSFTIYYFFYFCNTLF